MLALFNLLSSEATKTENFLKALEFTGKGMLGIFIVIGVIVLSIVVLNKVTSRKSNKQEDNE